MVHLTVILTAATATARRRGGGGGGGGGSGLRPLHPGDQMSSFVPSDRATEVDNSRPGSVICPYSRHLSAQFQKGVLTGRLAAIAAWTQERADAGGGAGGGGAGRGTRGGKRMHAATGALNSSDLAMETRVQTEVMSSCMQRPPYSHGHVVDGMEPLLCRSWLTRVARILKQKYNLGAKRNPVGLLCVSINILTHETRAMTKRSSAVWNIANRSFTSSKSECQTKIVQPIRVKQTYLRTPAAAPRKLLLHQ